jgi:predicted site-specific integrase-resolvase
MADENLLFDHEAAKILRISVVMLRKFARRGQVPAVVLPNGELRFLETELWSYIRDARPVGGGAA